MWAPLECMPTTLLPFQQLLYLVLSPKSMVTDSDLEYIDRWLKAYKSSLNVAKQSLWLLARETETTVLK